MDVRVITLRYQEGTQRFPEGALRQAIAGREVLEAREHFFNHGDAPHLALVLILGDGPSSGDDGFWPRDPNTPNPEELVPVERRPIYRDLKRWRNDRAKADGGVRWFGFKGIMRFGNEVAVGEGAASGSNRVKRGGNWNNNARNCRSANRNNNNPKNNNGFRPASTLYQDVQGPTWHSRCPADAGTNMPGSGRLVAQANAAPVNCFLTTTHLTEDEINDQA